MNFFGISTPNIEESRDTDDSGMRAAYYQRIGDESVLEFTNCMKRPDLKENQVMIKVLASSVNPVDLKLRENSMPEFFRPFPKVIGTDLCGVILQRGSKVSDKFRLGDKVFALLPYVLTGWGTACEYVVADEDHIAVAPDNVSAVESASLPLVSLTVVQALQPFVAYHHGNTGGRSVLIQAGAGGLGTFAIQYCKSVLGMKVYATCSDRNIEFLKELGADVIIDYNKERFEDEAVGMDVVFDPMAYMYETRTFNSDVLKKQGSFYINIPSSYNALTPSYIDPLRLAVPEAAPHRMVLGYGSMLVRNVLARVGFSVAQYGFAYVHPDRATLAQVAMLVKAGRVRPVVEEGNVFPLERAAAAHEKVKLGHVRGKVVLEVVKEQHVGSG